MLAGCMRNSPKCTLPLHNCAPISTPLRCLMASTRLLRDRKYTTQLYAGRKLCMLVVIFLYAHDNTVWPWLCTPADACFSFSVNWPISAAFLWLCADWAIQWQKTSPAIRQYHPLFIQLDYFYAIPCFYTVCVVLYSLSQKPFHLSRYSCILHNYSACVRPCLLSIVNDNVAVNLV